MAQLAAVNQSDVRKLLLSISPRRTDEINTLLDDLKPEWLIDRESDRNLFRARPGEPNRILIGLKCSKRLQAHAYATAVVLSSIGKTKSERDHLLAPVDQLLNWAVGVDLTRWLDNVGVSLEPGHILRATDRELPESLLAQLSSVSKRVGMEFFKYAIAFILLHELAHLQLGHTSQHGLPSLIQEKEADRFAAEWMADATAFLKADGQELVRFCAVYGIMIALLWLTIFNVFLGPAETETHPEGYDRLFQVMDQVINKNDDEEEYLALWQSVTTMLVIHMTSAGYDLNESDVQGDPRDQANYLIDRISKLDRKRSS